MKRCGTAWIIIYPPPSFETYTQHIGKFIITAGSEIFFVTVTLHLLSLFKKIVIICPFTAVLKYFLISFTWKHKNHESKDTWLQLGFLNERLASDIHFLLCLFLNRDE